MWLACYFEVSTVLSSCHAITCFCAEFRFSDVNIFGFYGLLGAQDVFSGASWVIVL